MIDGGLPASSNPSKVCGFPAIILRLSHAWREAVISGSAIETGRSGERRMSGRHRRSAMSGSRFDRYAVSGRLRDCSVAKWRTREAFLWVLRSCGLTLRLSRLAAIKPPRLGGVDIGQGCFFYGKTA